LLLTYLLVSILTLRLHHGDAVGISELGRALKN